MVMFAQTLRFWQKPKPLLSVFFYFLLLTNLPFSKFLTSPKDSIEKIQALQEPDQLSQCFEVVLGKEGRIHERSIGASRIRSQYLGKRRWLRGYATCFLKDF